LERADVEPKIQVDQDFEATYPDASKLATACVLNLMFLNMQLETFGEGLVHRAGIPSRAAFNVLTILDGADEPLPPSTIAAHMIVSRPTMTGILRSLERRRLIQRLPHPEDQRMVLIAITPEGHAWVTHLLPELHRIEKRWMSCLSEAEQRELLRMLAKLQTNAPTDRTFKD
jgi:DNA-binding MarR family transcriptional regulator